MPLTDPDALDAKRARLHALLVELGRVAVALSGGVDSGYLAAAAVDALGPDRVLALTATSPLFPGAELETAVRLAAQLGVEHRVLALDDLGVPEVAANGVERCYYCKRHRFGELIRRLAAEGDVVLLHGENADDHLQYRPGSRAARELGVRAPLAEAGLTKAEVRRLARQRGLPNWDLPAAACLATRFPYGTPLTPEGLERVERAEELLRAAVPGVQMRVRDHHPIARLEVDTSALPELARDPLRGRVVERLRECGYHYVTLDLAGYRSGSFDEARARQERTP